MKGVIFICLLSISTCLSRPEETAATVPAPTIPSTIKGPASVSSSPTPPANTTTHADNTSVSENPVPAQAGNATHTPTPAEATVPLPPKELPHDIQNGTKPSTTNSTDTEAAKKENVTPGDKNKKNSDVVTPTNNTTAKNETTTLKPEPTTKSTAKPTDAPKATDTPTLQARGFDGPSFIGGIILTLGLLAIGFMGFKYYKNQTERNYHTL